MSFISRTHAFRIPNLPFYNPENPLIILEDLISPPKNRKESNNVPSLNDGKSRNYKLNFSILENYLLQGTRESHKDGESQEGTRESQENSRESHKDGESRENSRESQEIRESHKDSRESQEDKSQEIREENCCFLVSNDQLDFIYHINICQNESETNPKESPFSHHLIYESENYKKSQIHKKKIFRTRNGNIKLTTLEILELVQEITDFCREFKKELKDSHNIPEKKKRKLNEKICSFHNLISTDPIFTFPETLQEIETRAVPIIDFSLFRNIQISENNFLNFSAQKIDNLRNQNDMLFQSVKNEFILKKLAEK